jgi:hypothetical protein
VSFAPIQLHDAQPPPPKPKRTCSSCSSAG